MVSQYQNVYILDFVGAKGDGGGLVTTYLLRLRLSSSRATRHIGQQLDTREDDPLQCVQPLPMRC